MEPLTVALPKGRLLEPAAGLFRRLGWRCELGNGSRQLLVSEEGVVTSGGRVLCVCALGENVTVAQRLAYQACEQIRWEGAFRRGDIGYRAVEREQAV